MNQLALLHHALLGFLASQDPATAGSVVDVARGDVALGSVVTLDAGRVAGVLLDEAAGLRVFRGIPYAAPPVGALRWRAPQPVAAWEGVRAAREFGKPCPQSPLIAYLSGEPLPETSEDCLTLNVWSAARHESDGLPVLVWIHGGGFVGGWAHQRLYDGGHFARRGLVFVSLNYRLGPLGFFSLPELGAEAEAGPDGAAGDTPGNYGLLDQLAALRWIQTNIAAFGGDPARVTLLGESAGATSVLALCASPAARGLFQRAIAQSPWLADDLFVARGAAEARGSELAAALLAGDSPQTLASLRALPADVLWQRLGAAFEPRLVLGGRVLPRAPEDLFAEGRHNRVQLIAGTTADEGSVFRGLVAVGAVSSYRPWLEQEFGALAEDVFDLYPAASEAELSAALGRLITDRWFLRGTRSILRASSRAGMGTWQYLFARVDPLQPALGAHHAVELPYLFGALDPSVDPAGREIAEQMSAAWVRFAASGDPNGPGLPVWPRFEPEREAHLVFGQHIALGERLRAAACDLLDGIRADARATLER